MAVTHLQQVLALEQHGSGIWLLEPQQHARNAALAGPRCPDQPQRSPGGDAETFLGATAGNRYLLKQSSALARHVPPLSRRIALSDNDISPPSKSASASIVLPGKVPVPPIAYKAENGSSSQTVTAGIVDASRREAILK